MKKINLFALLTIFFLGFWGCGKINKLPELEVTIAKEKISTIEIENSMADSKSAFKLAFEEKALPDIKHVGIGEKVTLDFGNNSPDNVVIQEIFLKANGENMYSDETIKEISLTKEKNKYYFEVEKSLVSALSSIYVQGKTDFRGYKIEAAYGKTKKIMAS